MTTAASTLVGTACGPSPLQWYQCLTDPHLVLYRDWDYFASMAASLRHYLFDHGTVPLWNFYLCGGKPELANPQSWAFTWPSVLAYAMPPYPALLLLWLLMTAVGVWSASRLFRLLGATSWGAWTGATLYAANGFFAAHFNQGHMSFCFFHLVPLLMLAWCKSIDHTDSAGRPRWLGVLFLATFALFSGGLPHALYYFYPAFVVLAVMSVVPLRREQRSIWAVLRVPLTMHVLGIVAAMYKLLPVVLWQIDSPRGGVIGERLTPADVFANTMRFATDYTDWGTRAFANQVWPAWEYDAFVGPLPWLAVVGCLFYRRRQRAALDPVAAWMLPVFGLSLVVIGTALACGNATIYSPAYYFAWLPLLNGVRAFARYQILVLFGLAALVSLSVSVVASRRHSAASLLARCGLSIVLCGPGLWQWWQLNAAIPSHSGAELAALYGLPEQPAIPQLVQQRPFEDPGFRQGSTSQQYLIDSGYFVANCYEPMTTRKFELAGITEADLAYPAPVSVALTMSGIRLRFSKSAESRGSDVVRIALRSLQGAHFNASNVQNIPYGIKVDVKDLPEVELTAELVTNGLQWGVVLTASAFFAAALLWYRAARASLPAP